MSEDLKTLMHEAADIAFDAPDLAAITRAGDQTVRRRRVATGVAGLAAVAVAAAGITALVGDRGDRQLGIAGTVPTPAGVTWVESSTLHSPRASLDLGRKVSAYVRTTAGFVFADGDGGVWVFTDGEPERIGQTSASEPALVADTDGGQAAWIDPSGGSVVVHDVNGASTKRLNLGPGRLVALDQGTVYLEATIRGAGEARDQFEAFAVDVGTGRRRAIDLDHGGTSARLVGAEDQLLAFSYDSDPDEVEAPIGRVGRTLATAVSLPQAYVAEQVLFSPDARYVSFDADEPMVYDTTTAKRVRFDIDGRFFASGYEWLDSDTIVMIASRAEEGPAELLTCQASSGTCSVAMADLGSFEELERDFALPVGKPLG